jgi:hypothetical protein
MLLLLPVGLLLLLAVPKIRSAVHISQQTNLLLSLVLFAIVSAAVIAQTLTEGRFLLYDTVALAGVAGIVIVRYLKAKRKW